MYDKITNLEVMIAHNDYRGKVTGRTVFGNRKISGTSNHDPYHNTMVYDVQFPYGTVKEYAASLIAENMVNQVDKDLFEYNLFDNILDYK